MKHRLNAVYESGGFRVLDNPMLPIHDGQKVQMIVETDDVTQDAVELATHVYDGLSKQDIDEIERIALDRRRFFGRESRV